MISRIQFDRLLHTRLKSHPSRQSSRWKPTPRRLFPTSIFLDKTSKLGEGIIVKTGKLFVANPEHEKILRGGVKVWNEWRQRKDSVRPPSNLSPNELSRWFETKMHPDLTGADLHDMNLEYADLNSTQLAHANLSGANLREVQLNAYSDEIGTDSEANRHAVRANRQSEESERSDAGILFIT